MITYQTLISAVRAATEEQGADFLNYLDTALEHVESRLARRLDNVGMTSVAYASLVTANPYVVVPSNHQLTRSFNILVGSERRPLTFKELPFVLEYWPVRNSVGTPKYYTNWGDEYILIAPACSAGREIEMVYEVYPSALSSANNVNWYTKNAGAALFAGLMVEANNFIKNFETAAYWETRFDKEVLALQIAAKRNRRDDATQSDGPNTTNNLTGS